MGADDARIRVEEAFALLEQAAGGTPEAPALRDRALAELLKAEPYTSAGDSLRPQLAWRLSNLLAIRYVQQSHDRSDREYAQRLLREVEVSGDEERRAVAQLWSGLLGIIGVFPPGAMAPLQNLATAIHQGAVVDYPAIRDLPLVGLDVSADPDAVAQLADAAAALGQVQPDLSGPLPAIATGLQGMARMMAGIPGGGELLRDAGRQWEGQPGSEILQGLGLLGTLRETGDFETHEDNLEAAAGGMAPGHVLRTLILAELGLGRARRAERTGAAADIEGIPQLLTTALGEIDEEHVLYDEILRQAAGGLLSNAALRPSAAAVEWAVELATQVRARSTGNATTAQDTFLLGMALTMRAVGSGRYADLTAAIDQLRAAAQEIPAGDPLTPTVHGLIGSVLVDRYHMHGSLGDLKQAIRFLQEAVREHEDRGVADTASANLTAILGMAHALHAIRYDDTDELDGAIELLEDALHRLPPADVGRPRATSALGVAIFASGAARHDLEQIGRGAALLTDAATSLPAGHAERASLTVRGGLARVIQALLTEAPQARLATVDDGIAWLRRGLEHRGFAGWERGRLTSGLGLAYQVRCGLTGTAADLDAAIEQFETAYLLAGEETGFAMTASTLRRLSEAYWARGAGPDRVNAVEVGLDELRAAGDEVLLQPDVTLALDTARGVADRSMTLARWALRAGGPEAERLAVMALEIGRGLVLRVAATVSDVAEQLRATGRDDLAQEWEVLHAGTAERPVDEAVATVSWEPPNDVRLRVLAALRGRSPKDVAPETTEALIGTLAGAVARAGADALVYLLPGMNPDDGGSALVVRPDGRVETVPLPGLTAVPGSVVANFERTARHPANKEAADLEVFEDALQQITAGTGLAVMSTLLAHLAVDDPRIVLVPCGSLGLIPWHAAACREATISYAASGRQLAESVSRERLPLGERPVLVGNPRTDTLFTSICVEGLAERIYSGTVLYLDGEGTPDEILAFLPGSAAPASVLHLSCHAWVCDEMPRSFLMLAGGDLSVERILRQARQRSGPAGLVVLSACGSDLATEHYDETLTLSTAFVSAGAAGVVGARWTLRDVRSAIFMFVFHDQLWRTPHDPARAVRETQLWMLNPHREIPAGMPDPLRDECHRIDLTAIHAWAAFAYQGAR